MSSTADILELEDLRRITEYKRAADVERCLKKQGIHVFWGRKGPWTTVALINAAGGLNSARADPDADSGVEFEDETS